MINMDYSSLYHTIKGCSVMKRIIRWCKIIKILHKINEGNNRDLSNM
jgi:hypothetical protein